MALNRTYSMYINNDNEQSIFWTHTNSNVTENIFDEIHAKNEKPFIRKFSL